MNSIYVQIASYRDPELVPTIKSLLKNAKYPHLLTICIAHQYDKNDEWDNLNEFKNDNRFIIIDIPYKESKELVGHAIKYNDFTTIKNILYS
jgi:hypothetical protein